MTEYRAYIRHLSVKKKSRFEEALQLVLQHLWTSIPCDTIRIDLYHFDQPNGQQAADADIKAMLQMNKKGFKWKTLLNDPSTNVRYQIMQMMRPIDYKFDLSTMVINKREPLFVKAAQLYQMGKEESYFDDSFEKPTSSKNGE